MDTETLKIGRNVRCRVGDNRWTSDIHISESSASPQSAVGLRTRCQEAFLRGLLRWEFPSMYDVTFSDIAHRA